jgi:hypothetical protein
MNRPAPLALLLTLLLPLMATAQPWIEVSISFPDRPLYVGEDVPMRLEIRSSEVRIDSPLLEQMPSPSRLQQVGSPRRLATTRTQSPHGEIIETQASILTMRPLQPGTLAIDPRLRAELLIQRRTIRGAVWSRRRQLIEIEAVTIDVRPLPSPAADVTFSGAIGQFTLKSVVSPTSVVVGDLITVQTAIVGSGNRDALIPPKLSPERHFRVYEPQLSSSTARATIFKQTLVPQSQQGMRLPALNFVHFDPKQGTYVEQSSDPVDLLYIERALPSRTNEVIDLSALIATNTTDKPPRPRHPRWRPESGRALVLTDRTTARIAPATEAMESFYIEAGTQVRVQQSHADWLLIQSGHRRGWIPTP